MRAGYPATATASQYCDLPSRGDKLFQRDTICDPFPGKRLDAIDTSTIIFAAPSSVNLLRGGVFC